MNYYNDFEEYNVRWLENLIEAGWLSPGYVDPRPIQEVSSRDLSTYAQCHFFAGIAGWSLALRIAGWPANRPVWTGSCPCQPFSDAGRRRGFADERHVWPTWRELIRVCEPPVIFGEQVASKAGRAWLAGVRADLEALGYAVGAADLCAASVSSPQIRQRLWWGAARLGHADDGGLPTWEQVTEAPGHRSSTQPAGGDGGLAHTPGKRRRKIRSGASEDESGNGWKSDGHNVAERDGSNRGLADAARQRLDGSQDTTRPRGRTRAEDGSWLGDPNHTRLQGWGLLPERADQLLTVPAGMDFWSRYDFTYCWDEKTRRFEPESFPLADGVPARVGRLRAYGNAIVPQVAAIFVRSFMDVLEDQR